jgi:hypothetical protein
VSIQLSPDHKWIWDGNRWLPISPAPLDPGASGAQAPTATYSASPVEAMPLPHIPRASGPTFDVPVEQPVVTPLWEQPVRSGMSLYLYVAAGAVVLVMAMIVLSSMNIVQLPWPGAGSTSNVRPAATPLPPLTTRTDYARADRFLNLSLAPALVGVNQTLPNLTQTCNGTLSNSCLSSITATDQQMKKVLSVIDGGEIPPCIAAGMSKLRIDLSEMETGLTLALSGFKDNQRNLVTAGLSRFGSLGQALPADAASLNQAQKTQCSTQEVGP